MTEKTARDTLAVRAELFRPIETMLASPWYMGATRGTNNTGEVMAIGQLLLHTIADEQATQTRRSTANLFDSQYAADAVRGTGRMKKNTALIETMCELLQQARQLTTMDFIHVKGHSADQPWQQPC